ncbi:MAG: transporter substrate-binding domain-containing protein [Desulfovibrionaceae bacterium]
MARIVLHTVIFCILLFSYTMGYAKKIDIGFDRDFPPFSFEDSRGEPTGFEIDIIQAILKGTGYTIQFKPSLWEKLQLDLSEGAVQVGLGFIKSPNSTKLFLFPSQTYYTATYRMFTKVKDRVPNISWLRGKFISVKRNSFAESLLLEFQDMRIKAFPTDVEALRALYDEQTQGYVGLDTATRWYIRKALFQGIIASGYPLKNLDLYYAINKRSPELVSLIDKGFTRIKQNGEYDRLYRKWFVEELTQEEIAFMKEKAQEAANFSLSQYSKKPVACALLTYSGSIYTGIAVESLTPANSISSTQAALAKAGENMDTEIRAFIIATPKGKAVEPSQRDIHFLSEYGEGILAIIPTVDGKLIEKTLGQLSNINIIQPNKNLKKD